MRINKILISLSCLFLAMVLVLLFSWQQFLKTPMVQINQEPGYFVFTQGMSAKQAATVLKKQKVIKSTLFFSLLVKFKGVERKLKAGEYLIEPGITTPGKLIEKMVKGEAVRHAFTVVEGWTFKQVLAAINNNKYIQHTVQDLNQEQVMAKIGHSGELPEGRFAPDTYLFSGKITDIEILNNAYRLMQKRLQQLWANKSSNANYSCSYQALIAASLIEKETAYEQEKPIIAGVILKRLGLNMLLQIDPTVIYGMGDKYKGKLNRSDYSVNTPYNTYIHKGLPPTPIAMPGESSIKAALNPIMGNYLYYVSKGDGAHHFSENFKDQIKAVNKYLKHK